MGGDEEGTLALLKARRRELMEPKITQHRGRIVKTTGDGTLVEFASAVDAMRCAMEIQDGMAERNATIPENRRVYDASALAFAGFVIGMDKHDRAAAFTAFEAALSVSPSSALTYILGSIILAYAGEAERPSNGPSAVCALARLISTEHPLSVQYPLRISSGGDSQMRQMRPAKRFKRRRVLAFVIWRWPRPWPN